MCGRAEKKGFLMEILVNILLAFTLVQFLVALVNLLFLQKPKGEISGPSPLVSVLIPARNEAENLRLLLPDLLAHDYREIEVLVFDDGSVDGTAEVVLGFSRDDARVQLIPSAPLPEGWLGKSWGCFNLGHAARGEYFLFLDADVRLHEGAIRESLAMMKRSKSGLLSLFPKQLMKTTGERITVPLMHYILLTLLPLVLVRYSPFTAHSAANGQFMLFDAKVYRDHQPHQAARQERAEDIRIARILKAKGVKVLCSAGSRKVTCRMYHGFSDAVKGFARNITAFFGGSTLLAALFWFVTTPGFLMMIIYADQEYLLAYLMLFFATKAMVSVAAGQHVLMNLALFVPQHIATGWILYRSVVLTFTRKQQWKGRYI